MEIQHTDTQTHIHLSSVKQTLRKTTALKQTLRKTTALKQTLRKTTALIPQRLSSPIYSLPLSLPLSSYPPYHSHLLLDNPITKTLIWRYDNHKMPFHPAHFFLEISY
jgi:hypothetical protein